MEKRCLILRKDLTQHGPHHPLFRHRIWGSARMGTPPRPHALKEPRWILSLVPPSLGRCSLAGCHLLQCPGSVASQWSVGKGPLPKPEEAHQATGQRPQQGSHLTARRSPKLRSDLTHCCSSSQLRCSSAGLWPLRLSHPADSLLYTESRNVLPALPATALPGPSSWRPW